MLFPGVLCSKSGVQAARRLMPRAACCPIHKRDEIDDLIDARGAGVVFLPAYSPDLNPIEHCWSKVKARLRALKPRTSEDLDLLEALVDAFATVTGHDIRGWFRHCGYQVAFT